MKLSGHVNEWCQAQINVSENCREARWCDFTCDFSEAGILNLDARQVSRVRNLLLSKGISARTDRQNSRNESLLECWLYEKCPVVGQPKGFGSSSSTLVAQEDDIVARKTAEALKVLKNETQNQSSADQTKFINPSKQEKGIVSDPISIMGADTAVQSSKKVSQHTFKSQEMNQLLTDVKFVRSQGIQGLLKSYQGRQRYPGGWDEDLFGCIEIYEMFCSMCHLTSIEKLEGLPITLSERAMSYYSTNVRGAVSTYQEAIEMLKAWFTSEEQRLRILKVWKETNLSEWFKRNPTKSQTTVFRGICENLREKCVPQVDSGDRG